MSVAVRDGLSPQAELVHWIVKNNRGATRNEIEQIARHLRICSVCPRVLELKKAGWLKVRGVKKDPVSGVHCGRLWPTLRGNRKPPVDFLKAKKLRLVK